MNSTIDHLNEVSERAAHQAIETAIVNYFTVRDCIVDLDDNSACILFDPKIHKKWIAKFNGLTKSDGFKEIPVSVPLERLPKRIIKDAQPILEEIIAQDDLVESYLKFRSWRGRVITGIPVEEHKTYLKISIIGATGALHQRDAIKKEHLDLGETYHFIVKQVKWNTNDFQILLSRRSKRIPEYVLRQEYPKYKFHCYRRIPGVKSWIKTTAHSSRWGLFYSKGIRKALAWEYLKLTNK